MPPVSLSVNATGIPTHMLEGPVIVPATAESLMKMFLFARAVPQLLVKV